QARASGAIDPRKALEDSVNRILAIAAVHELLTERRDDDVDLADLLGRLRATLVQGVADGRAVDEELEPVSLDGAQATALALVFSELLGNALEHGGGHVQVGLHRRNGDVVLAITDDGPGIGPRSTEGTGLSIVRALVRDELRGTLELTANGGTRAEVRFPA
ncbi:MAG TPA: sensor histidine kinase, partial [Gaiellaceae bacterium]